MDNQLPQIKEVIVVEGRDDTAAIKRAVRAVTIETHGFGISKTTWEKIARAHEDYGIIVFTDPDHAGEEIRRKILAQFPDAKQAFLSREKATERTKNTQGIPREQCAATTQNTQGEKKENNARPDIGIENAKPEDIREALEKAKARVVNADDAESASAARRRGDVSGGSADVATAFTMRDLDIAGLTGGAGAKARREKMGDILGIGYANAKGLLYKLNTLGIDRETFDDAVKKL